MELNNNFVFETLEELEKFRDKILDIAWKNKVLTYADVMHALDEYTNVIYPDNYYNYGWKIPIVATVEEFDETRWVIRLPKIEFIGDQETKEIITQNYHSDDNMVSHPKHYQSENGLEVIDVMEAFTSNLTGIEAVDTSQVLKYICRWKNKNGLQDLEKAQWYLTHLINHVKNLEKESK